MPGRGVSPFGVNLSGIVKGGSPSPGAWGCAPTFLSPTRRLWRRGKKDKEIFGDTCKLTPKGVSPLSLYKASSPYTTFPPRIVACTPFSGIFS